MSCRVESSRIVRSELYFFPLGMKWPSDQDKTHLTDYCTFSSQLRRILKTRINLSIVLESNDLESDGSSPEGESSASSSFLKQVKVPELPDLIATPEDPSSTDSPKLYVRDDGTVDWEGALQDRAALKKFGGAVWARINGQTPDDLEEEADDETASKEGGNVGGDADHSKPAVTAKIEDTPAIQKARKELVRLENELKEKEKAHTALVASGKC